MTNNLLFDFKVNKKENTVEVKREFDAPLSMVWEAWTNPEILDQWWAPKPYKTKTKSMSFKPGGTWLYCMISPQNDIHWCKNDYIEINTLKNYKALDGFCNEEGILDTSMPRTTWKNNFTEEGNSTTVNVVAQYESLEDLEKIISLGFKEGFTMALENLDQYFEAKFKLRHENKLTKQTRVCTYLNFAGNTEEAFQFYKSVFKSEFSGRGIQRFGDIPSNPDLPPVSENLKKMILHIELPITANHILMGTDAPKEMGFELIRGNNMHINIEPSSREEATRLFNALSNGGKIDMPLQDMFWGAYYGSFSDKFGINWMINYQNN